MIMNQITVRKKNKRKIVEEETIERKRKIAEVRIWKEMTNLKYLKKKMVNFMDFFLFCWTHRKYLNVVLYLRKCFKLKIGGPIR